MKSKEKGYEVIKPVLRTGNPMGHEGVARLTQRYFKEFTKIVFPIFSVFIMKE
jgi:hypothetical protein